MRSAGEPVNDIGFRQKIRMKLRDEMVSPKE